MTVLSGQSIRTRNIIEPYTERTRHSGGMTYGESPAGYDVRIAENIVLLPGAFALASTVERFVMPKDTIAFVHDKSTLARQGLAVQNTVIEPGWCGYLTLELTNHHSKFDNFAGIRLGAGAGGFGVGGAGAVGGGGNGYVLDKVIKLTAGQPIAQIVFHTLDEEAEFPYTGRYQDQPAGAQAARFLSDDADGKEEQPTFAIGDPVLKYTGDYQAKGTVRSVFTTLKGKTRYVVEHNDGILHIYSAANLRKL